MSEFSITTQQALSICEQQGLSTDVAVTEITSGSTNVVYAAGEHIIKIDPSDAPDSGAGLVKEHALYGVLPNELPYPEAVGLDTSRTVIARPYLVMKRLAGEPIEFSWKRLPEEEQFDLCARMGGMLGTIHAINDASTRTCAPEPIFGGHETFEEHFQEEVDYALAAIKASQLLGSATLGRLVEYFNDTSGRVLQSEDAALRHGSFNFRNILSNEADITGIIDWEGASFGQTTEELSLALFRFFPGHLGNEFLAAYQEHTEAPDQSPEQLLRYPLLYYLKLYPEIPTWTQHPGKQRYFRDITARILEETIGNGQ